MKIETRFNVGETVYFTENAKIKRGVIKQIFLTVPSPSLGKSDGERYEISDLKYDYVTRQRVVTDIFTEVEE